MTAGQPPVGTVGQVRIDLEVPVPQPTFHPVTKVYSGLAAKLPVGAPIVVHIDRYSVAEEGGIASQVGRSTRTLATSGDPDTLHYLELPAAAFVPGVTTQHGGCPIVGLSLRDIHPNAKSRDQVGHLVLVGSTLFCRLTTGAVTRQIQRADGDDENAFTILVLALAAHYAASVTLFRWADDPRRAGRDSANWASLLRRFRETGAHLQFGTTTYNPANDGMLLGLLGGMAQEDDTTRRKALAGGRLEHLMAGGAPMSEQQMPPGWRHVQGPSGRPVRVNGALRPEVDWAQVPVVRGGWQLHAAGQSYTTIGAYLAEHNVPRRGTRTPLGQTYAHIADTPQTLLEATKGFFVVRNRKPSTELELYLGKHTLMASGVYPYRVNNDLRQRGVQVAGLTPTYLDAHDPTGHFDLDLGWGFPVDPTTGLPVPRWGLTVAELDASRQRLIGETQAPRSKAGPVHTRPDDRVLSDFGEWLTRDDTGVAVQLAVAPRQHNSGKSTCVILSRPASEALTASGVRRGWTNARADSVRATFTLADLCADVSNQIDTLVTTGLLDPTLTAPAPVVRADTDLQARLHTRRTKALARLHTAQQDATASDAEAQGLRVAAGAMAARGDMDAFDLYDQQSRACVTTADAHRHTAAAAQVELDQLDTPTEQQPDDDTLDLTIAAYLVATLRRASTANGRGAPTTRRTCADVLTGWQFTGIGTGTLAYQVLLRLPLASSDTSEHQLTGTVRNIRPGSTLSTKDTVAQQVLAEGVDLANVTVKIPTTRRALITIELMPWLREHGITSRGAKNALIDHPHPQVPAAVHAAVTGTPNRLADQLPDHLRAHITAVYTDPELSWGDAAVPDNITQTHRLLATLTHRRPGTVISEQEAGLLTGLGVRQTRHLAVPRVPYTGGFTRPRYLLATTTGDTPGLQLIPCPHPRCAGVCDRAVLLPEVAASGYGVLCSTCRRTPNTTDPHWGKIAFPEGYLQPHSRAPKPGSLRNAPRTIALPAVTPFG